MLSLLQTKPKQRKFKYKIRNTKYWIQSTFELINIAEINNNNYTINRFNSKLNQFDIIGQAETTNNLSALLKQVINKIINKNKSTNDEVILEQKMKEITPASLMGITIHPNSKIFILQLLIPDNFYGIRPLTIVHEYISSLKTWIPHSLHIQTHLMITLTKGNDIILFNTQNRRIYLYNTQRKSTKLLEQKLIKVGAFKATLINDSTQDESKTFDFIKSFEKIHNNTIFIPTYLKHIISNYYIKEEIFLLFLEIPGSYTGYRFNVDELFK